MTQNASEGLTARQLQAVGLLMTGMTVTAVAAQVWVSREAVYRWHRKDWEFAAAMYRGKCEVRPSH